jgi:hypothetical protein
MLKSILFKGTIKGNGIVNYDGKGQKWMLIKHKSSEGGSELKFDNFKVAKHAFIKTGNDDNGKPQYDVRLKISSNCLRNAIFQEDQPFQNSMILHSKKLLNMSIASVASLLRGYMFEQEGFTGLKRKSPVIITDAEQTGGSYPRSTFIRLPVPKGQRKVKMMHLILPCFIKKPWGMLNTALRA